MNRPILFCINLILVTLVTRVVWGAWFTLTRSVDVLLINKLIRNGNTIMNNVNVAMRILMPITLMTLGWLSLINHKASSLLHKHSA